MPPGSGFTAMDLYRVRRGVGQYSQCFHLRLRVDSQRTMAAIFVIFNNSSLCQEKNDKFTTGNGPSRTFYAYRNRVILSGNV